MTAGNSTPLTDGAAVVLLASEEWAARARPARLAHLDRVETAAVDFVARRARRPADGARYAVPRMLERPA